MTFRAYPYLARSAAALFLCVATAALAPLSQTAPATPTSSPTSHRAVVPLPVAWLGHYRGTTVLQQSGKPSHDVEMELQVDSIPGSDAVSWKVTFVDNGTTRALTYRLDPIPGHRERFLLDDQNQGLIDQSMVGNALIAQFNIPGNIVYSRFEKVDAGVEVEISNFIVVPRKSGLPGAVVQSYPLLSIQRGTLKPVEN